MFTYLKNLSISVAFAMALFSLPTAAQAEDNDNSFALGARVGTLGVGGEASYKISKRFRLRIVGQGYSYSDTFDDDEIVYDGDVELFTAGPVIDWHPFNGSLKLSVGALYNGNNLDLKATPTGKVMVGDIEYEAAEFGSMTGGVDFDDVAPYAGIGFGNQFKGSDLSFTFEIGALFQGAGELTYVTDGTLKDDPTFKAEVEKEKQRLQEDIDEFEIYPVVSFALSYSF